ERHGEREEGPPGEELADHGLQGRDRKREQELDRPGPLLLGPEAHAHRGHDEQVQPREEAEVGVEARDARLEEAAEPREREADRDEEKGHQEHVRDRRPEVPGELPPEDGAYLLHTSPWVRPRKISSILAPGLRARRAAGVSSATSLPREMMMMRVQMASTSSRMCVERMTAFCAAMLLMRSRTSFFWFGSSPSVGSSITR